MKLLGAWRFFLGIYFRKATRTKFNYWSAFAASYLRIDIFIITLNIEKTYSICYGSSVTAFVHARH